MRTDVKVGLISAFIVILGVVIYFVVQGSHPKDSYAAPAAPNANAVTPATPGIVTPPTDSHSSLLADLSSPDTPRAAAPAAAPDGPRQIAMPGSGATTPQLPFGAPRPTPALTGGLPSSSSAVIPAGMSPGPSATPSSSALGSGSSSLGTPGSSSVELGAGRSTPPSGIGSSSPGLSPSGSWGPRGMATPGGIGSASPGSSHLGSGLTGLSSAHSSYTIQKGDTFTSIAKKFSVSRRAIESANPGVSSNHLLPGKSINIPSSGPSLTSAPGALSSGSTASHSTSSTSSGSRTASITPRRHAGLTDSSTSSLSVAASSTPKPGSQYKVQKGDTLTKIAKEAYGSASQTQVQKIFHANQTVLSSANDLPMGALLKLP